MKKTIVNRILPYLIVLIGTFILGFFVLFFKSHSTSTKTKFDFVVLYILQILLCKKYLLLIH